MSSHVTKLEKTSNDSINLINRIEEEIPKSTLYWFFISLAFAIIWTIYLAYYNSRVLGLICTFISNKLQKYGRINIGSISMSVLSGKIMFRAVHLITEDFSIRIEYGWIIFKWWRPYVYRELGEDMSHAETRVIMFIDGLEVHVYNRSATYSRLEKLFGLSPGEGEDETTNPDKPDKEEDEEKKKSSVALSKKDRHWRDLIPVCKIDITTSRFVFGNYLVPNTLLIHLDDSHVTYTTTTASTPFDLFMHDLKVKTDNIRIMFVPSDKYTGGLKDEPPRMMGEGFVLMQSTDVKLHYYMDQPGIVPYAPEEVVLADGEAVIRRTFPTMGLDIQCGKNTDFNYGPWADRQREYFWKLFYPPDYQPLEVTKVAEPGEKRQFKTFEFRMNIIAEATNDVLFSKNSETQAIHMTMGQGSYIEASIPWVVEETGYTSVIKGQLLLLDATTSMEFRSLLMCETLDFTVTGSYPLQWNSHQDWNCSFTACKATLYLIFQIKNFLTDLINDWSTKSVPDVFHFVPYTYNVNVLINQFELITLCSEYNWIDTESNTPENARIAFSGDLFDLSVQMPYTDYLPVTNAISFIFKVETVSCRLYLPENNTSRHTLIALSENMKIVDRDGNILDQPFCYDINKQWRNVTQRSEGWIDCWMTSNVSLTITYKYFPMPPLLKMDSHHVISSPSSDDIIDMGTGDEATAEFIPLYPLGGAKILQAPDDFDPGIMDPDMICVELEVAPSVICVYGSLLRNFLHVKENYFGEDQGVTDFRTTPSGYVEPTEPDGVQGPLTEQEVVEKEFDPRKYRPFGVTVSVTLHDIQGHLVKNCNQDNVPCPSVFVERLGFEMDKQFHETKLQVLISPAILIARDDVERDSDQLHLKEGHIALSGLQVRGHAMFSHHKLPLESETLEYAWLVEAVIGDVSGKLTSPQIQNIVESLQTFVMLISDDENSLLRPLTYQLCQHMIPQPQCRKLQPKFTFPCPPSEDIKYRMTRASVDSVNLFIVEEGSALNVQVFPIRISTCNLHGDSTQSGVTGLIENISFNQYISTAPIRHDTTQPEVWLESGGVSLGPIKAEAAIALPNQDFHEIQHNFLTNHDTATKRLWFLWSLDEVNISPSEVGKCGCLGGCCFFGENRNGVGFFHSRTFEVGEPTAVYRVSPAGTDPGFGQSLLYKDKLVFDVGRTGGWVSPSKEFSFTRGYMSNLTTPDTPGTSITVIEECVPKEESSNLTDESPDKVHRARMLQSPHEETQSSSSVATTSPNETFDNISINPFDTLRSVDSVVLRDTDRSGYDDTRKSARSISQSSSSSPPPFSPTSRSSQGHSPSLRSSGRIPQSPRSSIKSTSPNLVRMRSSGYDPRRQTSTISLESEMYFSAEEEDLSASVPNIPPFRSPQSMQDMHSSESDSLPYRTAGNKSPSQKMTSKSAKSDVDNTLADCPINLSASSSNSTLSYMSADTDPDETMSGGVPTDYSMVDLHGQVNKPITKSPVLLPCYSNHLTRLSCSNWFVPAPFPSRYHTVPSDPSQMSLSSAGQSNQNRQSFSCLPLFVKTKQGFSTRIMKAKESMFPSDKGDESEWDTIEQPLLDATDGVILENASRTTATVKLKGSVDILLTPLLLESFQRLCESVSPALSMLHPSAILDTLHFRCLDLLKSQNRLKKGDGVDPDTPDSDGKEEDYMAPGPSRQFSSESRGRKGLDVKTSSYQALITLPKINICALQAGMVEELISFSALDNIHELTCVSLIGVSVDDIRCQLLSNSHSCKFTGECLPNQQNSSPNRGGKSEPLTEVDRDNIPEKLMEEDVGTLNVKAVHLQMRRLLKDSNFSEDIVLTAIPEQKSKVMFTFENDVTKLFSPMSVRTGNKAKRSMSMRTEKEIGKRPTFNRNISQDVSSSSLRNIHKEENPFDAAPQPKVLRQKSKEKPEDILNQKTKNRLNDRQSIGYIMFECGLEDISINAERRLGYKEKSMSSSKLEHLPQLLKETEDLTQASMEGQGHSSGSQSKGLSSSSGNVAQGHDSSHSKSHSSERPSVFLGSQELNVSSNSVHSWDSRVSIPSNRTSLQEDFMELKGDATSGILHLKTVWFNFAAPPPLPIKRKADFTKYDWNLLSTATPTINAWLNPLDRLMTAARELAQALTHRTNSVIASIMTEALEEQSIHMPYKCKEHKYQRMTELSRTLQEDASCQLLCVLRRYIHKSGTNSVEIAVNSDTIPQLITIQKGILALTRQWKNILYMPHLSQYSFKARKQRPYTVSFEVQEAEPNFMDDDAASVDIIDEKASLIDEDAVSYRKSDSVVSLNKLRPYQSGSKVADAIQDNTPVIARSRSSTGDNLTSRPRGSRRERVRAYESPQRDTNPHMTTLLRNESVHSFHSTSMSIDPAVGPTPPATPYKGDQSSRPNKEYDLYRWMSAQQNGFETMEDDPGVTVRRQDSFLEAFGRGLGHEDSHTDVNAEHYTLGTSIMQLAASQSLFKPFLQSIGLHVENVRPTAMLKKFGGNLSLQGKLDVLRIQIADSVRSKGKGKGKSKRGARLTDSMLDSSAFLCEQFTLTISMQDVFNFERKNSEDDDRFRKYPFKFAMHKLEAKPATLQVNLLANVNSMTQNVDMPLLRLIHQFVTMIGNVNETRIELKQGHSSVDWIRTHRKQDSKGSSSSAETVHSDISRTGLSTSKNEEQLTSSRGNVSEIKSPDASKPTRNRPSISGFRFNFDTIRPGFPSSLKKSTLKPTKESKKAKVEGKSPEGRSDLLTPPQSLNLSDSVNIEMADTSSPAIAEKTIVDVIKEETPKCWRTLYHLLELYSTMPETKTVRHPLNQQPLPVIEEEPSEKANTSTPSGSMKTRLDAAVEEEAAIGNSGSGCYENTPLARSTFSRTRFKQSIYIGDSIPLVVFGIAKIEKVKILAVLSGLKLEAELQNVHASGTIKEKVKGFLQRKSSESSVTAHVGHTNIVLLEGPSLQTVVTVKIDRSQALHTTVKRRGKGHNSALVSIGEIEVDIPQHPAVLHGMLTRGTNQLSTTLQEFRRRRVRTSEFEFGTLDSRSSEKEPLKSSTLPKDHTRAAAESSKGMKVHIHLKAVLQGITIGASLLPSLRAQHKTGQITISGTTMKKARFTLDLPHHTLSFKSKVQTMDTSIPSSASIDLPPIHVYADYRHYSANASVTEDLTEGLMLKEGNYLNAVAEVGMFEHSLTTDLLNHLVFVQKVFMKEVNELLQKVSGSDRPVPLWSDPSEPTMKSPTANQILYSFHFRLKGIQITATTPTSSAVRLETEAIDLEVSNRVHMAANEVPTNIVFEDNQKVFIKAQVDLSLSLGQLLKNPMFEEADPEFQIMAFFKTKISVRNALQDEMIPGVSTDQEALLINLTRPIVLAQPMAFDKAVLVWLNYKNAYEYWTEQRLALNKEVQYATRMVIDRLPQIGPHATNAVSTLFLQLTVDDIGLCLPISSFNSLSPSGFIDNEPGSAVVLTIESTQISACSSGSLVSKGRFTGFCLRVAGDFEHTLDDWKPSKDDAPVMNACVVPEGTYEVCSRTINKQSADQNSNAKWILNIRWEMQGTDVHLDTNLGKRLSALADTLTSLTGESDEDLLEKNEERLDVSLEDMTDFPTEMYLRRTSIANDNIPKFMFDTTLDPKQRARRLEREMNEQAKVVQDLKALGASQATVEMESRKLEELKGLIFHDFRREVLSRIKKQSDRASVIKDKLGIGSHPAHIRSRSYGGRHDDKHRESAPAEMLKVDSLHKRGVSDSAEIPYSLPAKVQFGETVSSTYTPPITPDETPEHRAVPERQVKSLIIPRIQHATSSSSSFSDDSDSNTDWNVFKDGSSERDISGGERDLSGEGKCSNPSTGSGGSKTIIEPNVDFQLDVKVFIDSGKCVLHPKESKEREDGEKRNKREKTPTDPLGSPNSRRKGLKKQESTSQIPSGKKPAPQQPVIENTVFFLPGVDVMVAYNSKTDNYSSPASTLSADAATADMADAGVKLDDSSSTQRVKQGAKKASLFAWLSLQSLPEEMIISPCLLDYLEQALEPIPMSLLTSQVKKEQEQAVLESMIDMDLGSSYASIGAPTFLGSFPVDVVVFIRVEPSIIRFNCLPASRVECLLQVPSLELVFSTNRSDMEAVTADGTPPLKNKFSKKMTRERNLSGGLGGRDSRNRTGSATSADLSTLTSSGGLSVTGCLSDFSLYIFHPYGGGQRKTGVTVSRYLGSIQEQSVLSDASRKDSLSLNVEFVNLNISRSRKLEVKSDGTTSDKSNVVRFSAVCDIGTAAFKYDMRRLSEILSFPKSWYRRNLARRLFLGDESWVLEEEDSSSLSSTTSSLGGSEGFSPSYSPSSFPSSPSLHVQPTFKDLGFQGHHRRGSSGDKLKIQLSPDFRNELADRKSKIVQGRVSVPQSPSDGHHTSPEIHGSTSTPIMQGGSTVSPGTTPNTQTKVKGRRGSQQQHGSRSGAGERKSAGWQTLVLYDLNVSQLDVHVNMSNVMGNTVWNTQKITSQGRLSIDSTGHKDLMISTSLGGSHFDSKGGVVGGNVDLQEIATVFECIEDPRLGKDPLHEANVSISALEGRVDYMGSSVLMTRLSDMKFSVRDEWKIAKGTNKDAPLATTRTALLFAHAELGWDKFHILISRSTTPDLIKIASKLEEFIMQQFTSSRRALGAMGPIPASVRQKMQEKHKSGDEESFLSELRHHRHWQKALSNITGCRFTMLPSILPKDGMILGGTSTLRGNNLTLGCFHGINFKSKSWAIFTMNEPYICFATEAQKTKDEGTHVVQDLTFYVGHDYTSHLQGKHMAHILKMSRGHSMPPTFTNACEWFHYAFSTSDISDLDAFPRMQRAGSASPSDSRKARKLTDYNHDSEMIFALPSMQLHLRSKHLQTELEPVEDDPKPEVDCSFVTEFEDHIFVAMDAEILLFLHDLVMSYIREMDKGTRISMAGPSSKSAKSPVDSDKKKMTDPVALLQQDWREFNCNTWHLEPTVRLLHWASKQIDPVGADFVLQKLGFSHARVTIPKWMQRGLMDPSDKVLSVLVNKLIVMLREPVVVDTETTTKP